jgi:hypothetical protein
MHAIDLADIDYGARYPILGSQPAPALADWEES